MVPVFAGKKPVRDGGRSSCRGLLLCRLCGTPGDPYDMTRSSTDVTRPRANLFHLETGLSQTIAECLIGTGRPYGQYTSRPQRRESRAQANLGIKPVISFPGQSLGTVVDVQQDGIIGPLPSRNIPATSASRTVTRSSLSGWPASSPRGPRFHTTTSGISSATITWP